MKTVKQLSRIILGIVFIYSGFVKGIDPWGSAYKFTDYFNAMGLDWMLWSAFSLGVLQALAEFIIGVALVFNIFIRFFSWLALAFMAVFLPITLWVALKNPVTDCGCFGDALVITNWQTFYKNIVLTLLAIIVVVYRKNMKCLVSQRFANVLAALVTIAYAGIAVYSYRHLPVFDFRPYKVGVNIPESMVIPEGAAEDVYENTFYYKNKKNGKVEAFSENDYPWQDTLNWEFSDMKSTLVEKGYQPPIHDFSIETKDGDNIIDFFMNDDNYVFMLVAYNLDKSCTKSQDKINALAEWAMSSNMSFFCLTASIPEEAREFAEKNGAPYEFFNCDEITLKTIIRSNPGLVLLKKGTIMAKWHCNDIPAREKLESMFLEHAGQ